MRKQRNDALSLQHPPTDLRTALQANPFFKLAGLGMEIRELAAANPGDRPFQC